MKSFIAHICFILAILFLFHSCSQQSYVPELAGPYLGQLSPGMTAELFDPGVFNEGEFLG